MEKKKELWRCFIPLLIEIPAAVLIVCLCGYYEISSFYERPDHIGFAIPIGTFFVALSLLAVTVILAVICMVRAYKRRQS